MAILDQISSSNVSSSSGKVKPEQVTKFEPKIDEEDYKKDDKVKPPFSFAAMITMAIRSSPSQKMILKDIYDYITKNFPYYKPNIRGWQNSVRHNLSMHKCFIKIPREGGGERKGNYWGINAQGEDVFQDGDYKRRRKMKHQPRLGISVGNICQENYDHPRYNHRSQQNYTPTYGPGPSIPLPSFGTQIPKLDPYSQCYSASSLPPYNHLTNYASQSQFTSHALLSLNPPPNISAPIPQQPVTQPTNSYTLHQCMNQSVVQPQNQTMDMPNTIHHPHGNVYCYSY